MSYLLGLILSCELIEISRPQADDILAWNLENSELISIASEAVSHSSSVVAQEISAGLVLAAKPQLLVPLKEGCVVEQLSVKHRKAASVDVYIAQLSCRIFDELCSLDRVTLWVHNDRVCKWVTLDAIRATGDGDHLSAVLFDHIILYRSILIDSCCHLFDELRIREHKLIDEHEIATFDRNPLSLVTTLCALSRVAP